MRFKPSSAWRHQLIACLLCALASGASAQEITDAFSPRQGATELVVQTIDSAQHSIRLVAYTFTAPIIADALVKAHQHGIDVQIVLDEKASHQKSSLAYYLASAGLPVRLDGRHAITHDKFIVADDATVETGSFNYTRAADRNNAENVIVVHDRDAARDYVQQFQRLWGEAISITISNEAMQ